MSRSPTEIARERQLDWLLAETLGEAPRAATPKDYRAWLTAAAIVLGVGVAVAVAVIRTQGDETTAQDPTRKASYDVYGPEHLDAVPDDATHIKGYDFDDAALAKLDRFTKLVQLDLSGMRPDAQGLSRAVPITDAGVAELAQVTSLRELSLSGCHDVTGASLGQLRALPRLERLDLSYTGVTSDGLAALPLLPSLRWLSLSGCLDFHGRSLADVARIPGLRVLELRGCATVSAKDALELTKALGLRHLDLRDCMGNFRGQTAAGLEDLDDTQVATQDGVGITDEVVAALAELPLEWLSLRGCSALTDAIGPSLARMAALHSVDLGELPRTTGAVLQHLPRGVAAVGLFANRHYERAQLVRLAELPKLAGLDLGGIPQVDDATLTTILAGKQLLELSLARVPTVGSQPGPDFVVASSLTPAIATALAEQRELLVLDAAHATWFDASVAAALGDLPRLHRVDLSGAIVHPGALAALGRCRSLREVSLARCQQLTTEELRGLASAPLEDVDLYGSSITITDEELHSIARGWSATCRVRLRNGSWLGPR